MKMFALMFPTACIGFSCTPLSSCSRAGSKLCSALAQQQLLSAGGMGQVTLQRGLGGVPTLFGLVKDEFQITCNTTGVWSVCMLLKKCVTDKNEIAKYIMHRSFKNIS